MTQPDNSAQIADWDGPVGERWAALVSETDALTLPFGEAAIQAASPERGETMIDIGCGCGATTLRLAESSGSAGTVVGVDVSRKMLEVARSRAAAAGLTNVTFLQADAAREDLGVRADLLFSRFGVMFFADPEAAFGHMRRFLRPGGRFSFVCWRSSVDNPWASIPLEAARRRLGVDFPATDPNAPGPFAFADAGRLLTLLARSGFSDPQARPFEAPIRMGDTPRSAAEMSIRIGPLARLARELPEDASNEVVRAVEEALAGLSGTGSRVCLPGRVWLVTGRG